ncbi:uncharacterized protein LOC131886543 [Tigriopus californicus]|uniref:uncharacterized protein LOC131886543 n=1 Tax=Tigriopus californicus TaxID=6832 RepID=UPI0027D9DE83|nr:uncharacterized protein LOC131886543 [Tigriopus californicus]XP_059090893.1 uncharacterized protein LOC131886543 [Tigriopus californicus]
MSNEYIMTPAESIPYGRTASPQCGSVFKKSSMGSPFREIRNASGASSTAEFDLEEDILIGSPGLAQLPSSGLSQTSVDSHSVNSLDSINSVTSNASAYAPSKKFRPKTLSIPGLGKISLSPRHQILPSHECIPISGSLPTRKPKDKTASSWVGNTHGILKDIRGNAHCAPSSHYGLTSFPGNFKSAPSTPLGGSGRNLSGTSAWTICTGGQDFENYFLSGSISSIDEAQEAVSGRQCGRKEKSANEVNPGQGHLSPTKGSRTRSKSRLSLNINDAHQGRDNLTVSPSQAIEASESNPTKSQNLIPKFLRNSFSKLMNRDKRSSEDEAVIKQLNKPISPSQEESSSLSQSIRSLSSAKGHPLQSNNNNYNYYNNQIWGEKDEIGDGDFSPETSGLIAESPTMSQFYEDAKVMALPVIPFAFPTAVLAERMKTKNREALLKKKGQIVREKTPSGDSNKTLKSSPKEIRSSASSRRSNSIVCCDDDFGPKTLDSLVSIAKMELYSEALQGHTNMDEVIATSMGIKSPPMRPRLPRADSLTDEEDFMLHMPPTNVSRTFEDDGYLEMCPKQQQQYDRILYQEPHQPFQSQFRQTPPSGSRAYLRRDSMEEHFPMDMSQS